MWPERAEDAAGERFGSEVVVRADRLPVQASRVPHINNLNVTEHSTVHVGPKIVTVNQSVHNTEVVKGRFLCLELVYPKHARTLRCSVAVFVCWSLVVAIAIITYFLYYGLTKQKLLDLGLSDDWYLQRVDWQAMPAYFITFLRLPLQYVIIGHSVTSFCKRRSDCIEIVMTIQQEHLRRGLGDIGPNFLVGGSGLIFEGRGANVEGAMIKYWNPRSITIMFIGDYSQGKDVANQIQYDRVNLLLDSLVQHGVLRQNYVVYGQCQVSPHTVPPGPGVMEGMSNFEHWDVANRSLCLPT